MVTICEVCKKNISLTDSCSTESSSFFSTTKSLTHEGLQAGSHFDVKMFDIEQQSMGINPIKIGN